MALIFDKLVFYNFRRYVQTELKFNHDNTPTVVIGKNGTGKTTVKLAIEWLWKGGHLDDKGKILTPTDLTSKEREAAYEPMIVTLYVTNNGQGYKIERKYRENVTSVNGDLEITDPQGNPIVKDKDQTEKLLQSLLPNELLTEFYLFDGDSLNLYEQLLTQNESNAVLGSKIQEVLGLPAIADTRINLNELKKKEQNKISSIASKETALEAEHKALQQVLELMESANQDLDYWTGRQNDAQTLKDEGDSALEQAGTNLQAIGLYKGTENQLNQTKTDKARLQDELTRSSSEIWKAISGKSKIVQALISKLEDQNNAAQNLLETEMEDFTINKIRKYFRCIFFSRQKFT